MRSLVAASADVTASTVIVVISGAMTFTPFVILTAIGMNGLGNPARRAVCIKTTLLIRVMGATGALDEVPKINIMG